MINYNIRKHTGTCCIIYNNHFWLEIRYIIFFNNCKLGNLLKAKFLNLPLGSFSILFCMVALKIDNFDIRKSYKAKKRETVGMSNK